MPPVQGFLSVISTRPDEENERWRRIRESTVEQEDNLQTDERGEDRERRSNGLSPARDLAGVLSKCR